MRKIKEDIICYKLLKEDLTSATTPINYAVRYSKKKYAYAEENAIKAHYGLCVFDSMKNLLEFEGFQNGIRFRVFKVLCKEEILPLPMKLVVIKNWNPLYQVVDAIPSWPSGTRMFERVKLLEEIFI